MPPTVRSAVFATVCFAAGAVVGVAALRELPESIGRTHPTPAAQGTKASPGPSGGPSGPASGMTAGAVTPAVVELADPAQTTQIETTAVKRSAIPLTGRLAARLTEDENVTSRLTVPIDGRVLRLIHQVGDTVKAGEPLIEIDAPDLGQALADAGKARADEALKRAALSRTSDLFAHGVAAQKEVEAAKADLAESQAELARTDLRLRNLNALGKVKGQTFVLVSPINGVVTERNATLGQEVQAASGNVMAVVTDPRRLNLLIDVPESDAPRLALGMPIDFSVDGAPDQTFHARLFRIAPQLDPVTRRVQVRATVENPEGRLKPEMFATALPVSPDGAVVAQVPTRALLQNGSRTVLFVTRDGRRFEQREVDVAVQQGDSAWLRSGVEVGDKVVTAGALLLKTELAAQSVASR